MLQEVWYSPYREKYMDQNEQDTIRGRLVREQGELHVQVGLLAAKLKDAGRNFSRLGDDLQQDPPVINVSKEIVEEVVSGLWDDISRYEKAAEELSAKNLELSSLGR
jgi:hypothetical protein